MSSTTLTARFRTSGLPLLALAVALGTVFVAACGSDGGTAPALGTDDGDVDAGAEASTGATTPARPAETPTTAGTGTTEAKDAGAGKDASTSADAGTTVPTAVTPLVTDVAVKDVAVFQGVKVLVVKEGAKVTTKNAPLVAKRDAWVRVYVTPTSGFRARDLVGELVLTRAGAEVFRVLDTKAIAGTSTESDSKTTFNFAVPGASVTADVSFRVAIRETTGTATPSTSASTARFPQNGDVTTLGASLGGEVLKVVFVPVKYMADGSGRTPDTSAAAIERYRAAMHAMYPAAKVEMTARAPYEWSRTISRSGSGFSSILQAMVTLRQTDGVADDVYYYGAFNPSANFNTYCSGSCVTGLSGLIEQDDDPTGRASVGVGFADQETTMVHEVGHAHGRPHAPCGVSDSDPSFPYSGGTIGVWGYDFRSKALVSPSTGKDFMSYCTPEWVSDYTFGKLFERIRTVNGAPRIVTTSPPADYRFVEVDDEGRTSDSEWTGTLRLDRAPSFSPRTVSLTGRGGERLGTTTGHFVKYADLPGGYLLVRDMPAGARAEILPTR